MNILTIDTVLDKTYIALSNEEGDFYKTIESDENNYHSLYLIEALKEMDALNKIEYLGVNTGVGSFTGIRVGLSIAKIITNQLNIKAVPFKTAEILSYAYKNKNIMLDAKRGSVFYSRDGETIEIIPYDSAKEIIKSENKTFICDCALYKKFNLDNMQPFENSIDLSRPELELVKIKIKDRKTINSFQLEATYIQTPPIFVK